MIRYVVSNNANWDNTLCGVVGIVSENDVDDFIDTHACVDITDGVTQLPCSSYEDIVDQYELSVIFEVDNTEVEQIWLINDEDVYFIFKESP